jgi:hypothetical protein
MRPFSLFLVLLLSSCGRSEREREAAVEATRVAAFLQIESVLSEVIGRADQLAVSAERILSATPRHDPGRGGRTAPIPK